MVVVYVATRGPGKAGAEGAGADGQRHAVTLPPAVRTPAQARSYLGIPAHHGFFTRVGSQQQQQQQQRGSKEAQGSEKRVLEIPEDLDLATCDTPLELVLHPSLVPESLTKGQQSSGLLSTKQRRLLLIFVLLWCSHIFLPRWTSTPAYITFGMAIGNIWIDFADHSLPASDPIWTDLGSLVASLLVTALFEQARCCTLAHIPILIAWFLRKRRVGTLLSLAAAAGTFALIYPYLSLCPIKQPLATSIANTRDNLNLLLTQVQSLLNP